MNISPAQVNPEQALGASSVQSPASASKSQSSQPEAAADTSPSPQAPSPFQLSTELQIDDHHQEYYEFVDNVTGAVVFEIPPEALRAIAESLDIPAEGQADFHNLDVTS